MPGWRGLHNAQTPCGRRLTPRSSCMHTLGSSTRQFNQHSPCRQLWTSACCPRSIGHWLRLSWGGQTGLPATGMDWQAPLKLPLPIAVIRWSHAIWCNRIAAARASCWFTLREGVLGNPDWLDDRASSHDALLILEETLVLPRCPRNGHSNIRGPHHSVRHAMM